jgi:NADH dehydrogenase
MEQHQIVIVGSGFAGVWAALGGAAVVHDERAEGKVRITLVSPDGWLVVRPRLYEADLAGVRVALDGVLSPVGVHERRAVVKHIDSEHRELMLGGENPGELRYDQLVLCAGSQLQVPGEPGTVHSADTYPQALALHDAVAALGRGPERELKAVVVGGGFTGLELAAELSDMLGAVARQAGLDGGASRVRLVEQAGDVAPEFGPHARAVIGAALDKLGVETVTGERVVVDADRVSLADGQRLDGGLVVWSTGPRASGLNEQLGVELDSFGRVPVDGQMATDVDGVWAGGDSARAIAVGDHVALMSCQHAMPQGRQAGENAARSVLGRRLRDYHQPLYVTCLDLGSAGAVLTRGFERDDVLASGDEAKQLKQFINRSVIYPPKRAAELLKLGSAAPAGRAAAAIQTFALSRDVLRHAAIARGQDRAAQNATAQVA